MKNNVVLIGFMGTGKSAIGFRLAQRLKKEFVDMDREIEIVTGMSIPDIFRCYGEVRFRSEESLMAKKLGTRKNLVIATGGGFVLLQENMEALSTNGVLICLDASAEDIFERVNRKKGSRPLLKKGTTLEDIKKLLQEREPYYACADVRVNTSGKDIDQIIREVLEIVRAQN
ncbi:MAG: shikimate kinase [Bacillota bacterium]|nr:shikimate kinase [Bacillota bacterium]